MQTYENFLKKQSGGLGMLEGVAHLERLEHLKHLFCSDLDQKRAVFLVQKRNETPETPETPETLGTLETLCVDVGIAVL